MKDAYLLLGDGQIFKGKRIGSERDAVGELVFTTAMVGCNKTLSDPNYYGQLLLFTFPAVGNCGLITADFESGGVHAFGVVVRELCGAPSNFRSEGTLGDYLQKADVPGICGVDTRRLTAILRDKGTMNACICADPTAVDMDALNGYAVGDAVARVSVKEKTHYETPDARCRVSLLDYGTSAELLAELQSRAARSRSTRRTRRPRPSSPTGRTACCSATGRATPKSARSASRRCARSAAKRRSSPSDSATNCWRLPRAATRSSCPTDTAAPACP